MKTSELNGAALDWAVAKCEGWLLLSIDPNDGAEFLDTIHSYGHCHYSTEWIKAGPIIERENIYFMPAAGGGWLAKVFGIGMGMVEGQTPLIAAMRCYVASTLGDEVDVPEELK